jgi:hypothetical protein
VDCITEWILTRANNAVSIPGYYKVCERLHLDNLKRSHFAHAARCWASMMPTGWCLLLLLTVTQGRDRD